MDDTNNDGKPDLVCHFETHKTGFIETDNVGILKGLTFDGTHIDARDAIHIVGKSKAKNQSSIVIHLGDVEFATGITSRPYPSFLSYKRSDSRNQGAKSYVNNPIYIATLSTDFRPSLERPVLDRIFGRDAKEDFVTELRVNNEAVLVEKLITEQWAVGTEL